MGQVAVTVNGRTYRLRCDDGEEPRLLSVAAHVREHVDRLTSEHGQIGDERLILMAAIMIADELFEVREQRAAPVEQPVQRPAAISQPAIRPPLPQTPATMPAAIAATVPPSRLGPQPPAATAVSLQQPAAVRPSVVVPAASPAPKSSSATISPPPAPAPPAHMQVAATPVRAVEHLDATALMKGIEKKAGRP